MTVHLLDPTVGDFDTYCLIYDKSSVEVTPHDEVADCVRCKNSRALRMETELALVITASAAEREELYQRVAAHHRVDVDTIRPRPRLTVVDPPVQPTHLQRLHRWAKWIRVLP